MADVYNISVARLVSFGTLDGQLISNVTYWERAGDIILWDEDALNALCEQYADWLNLSLMPLLSNSYSVNQLQATVMKADGAAQATFTPSTPITGDNVSPALPNSVAACATISTGLAGRSYRGRIYVAGLCEDMVGLSRLNTEAVSDLNASLGDLITAEGFSPFTLGVYSKVSGGVKRAAGVFTPATQVALRDNVIDSQRRRLPGRGA